MESQNMIELISGNGTFNVLGLQNFVEDVKLLECGLSYAIVSIMGPQSSGKSTLLNQLFGTKFKEMNAFYGRSQTTTGVWLAKSSSIIVPTTLVMDLEGNDSSERGEDDVAFEKQSAVFALAVSDVVLINMWCHDIGRERASNKSLLTIVFQARMRLFRTRKTTLMFVIRDMTTQTPLGILKEQLEKGIQMIWDSVMNAQPQQNTAVSLSQVFDVKVVALSNYELKDNHEFNEQVASLREHFSNSLTPGGLAEDRQEVVPPSTLPYSMEKIWQSITANQDLNLPTHKIMVATFRCKQIADKKYEEFIKNEDWLQYEEESRSGFVSRLGEKLDLLIANCLNKYDSEVEDFDSKVRSDARIDLRNKLLQHIRPALQLNLKHLALQTIQKFIEEFNTALTKGENLSSASSRCKENYMSQFREHSEGYSNVWNDAIIPEKVSTLNNEFDKYIAFRVASQKKGGFSFTKIAQKLSLMNLGFNAIDFIAPGVGSSIGLAFGEMFGALGDGIGSAADAVSGGYENAIDEFSMECDNTTLEHGERVANAAHELGEGFGNAAHELGDGVKVAAHELGDGLNHTGDLIEDRVKHVVHTIGGGVEPSSH